MKALILAAGRGSRLKSHTEEKPKSMLNVAGKTLIERSISNLQKAGFSEVIIVVGYLHHILEEFITSKFPDFCTIIHNIDYTRGSGSSFISAVEHLVGEITIVESDLLYDLEIAKLLFEHKEDAMAMGIFDHGRDEVKIVVEGDYIKQAFWGGPKTDASGDWVGFTKLSSKTTEKLRKVLEATDPEQGKEINYEDFLFPLIAQKNFKALNINHLPWLEIDDEQDLLRAKEVAARIDQK